MNINQDIVFETVIPKRDGKYCPYRFESKKLNRYIQQNGLKLYCHQVEGFKLIKEGKNIVITTPTSSGKSLIYTFSILEEVDKNPSATAILIFPLVALANDQYHKINSYVEKTGIDAVVSVYTGSTSAEKRKSIRSNIPNILITTPDMLNVAILPFHRNWAEMFANLRFVVIDELHSYRGILGSHVANVIRRLNRLAKHHAGETPQYILNSATIHNPVAFARKFIDSDVVEVKDSTAPSPNKILRIYNKLDKNRIADIALWFLENDIPTIVFLDSRKEVELFNLRLRDLLRRRNREELIKFITPYRSGYTFEERREIEEKLTRGEYKLVVSTSALEMGIDIGSIDACILVGYPGTLSATWQRFGRAGRRGKTAYNILIPKSDVLDNYFLKNPEDLIKQTMEEPVINPSNPYILKKHLMAMAFEKPIEISEIKSSEEKYYIRELILENKLIFKNNKVHSTKKHFFHIRSSDSQFNVVEKDSGTVVGQLNSDYVMYEAFKDAVYLHNGKSYVVRYVDFQSHTVYVSQQSVNYFTDPLIETEINIINEVKHKKVGEVEIFYGDINAKTRLIGYSKRNIESSQRIGDNFFEGEDIIERDFQTKALWFTIPDNWQTMLEQQITTEKLKDLYLFLSNFNVDKDFLQLLLKITNKPSITPSDIKNILQQNETLLHSTLQGKAKKSAIKDIQEFVESLSKVKDAFVGALHAVEHSMIGIFSIIAMNDRWDIGGLSTPLQHQTNLPTIFIYDGFEGGIGYSEVGFERFVDLISLTAKNIVGCSCLNGCPSCILSPKCGNSNEFLDKSAAKILLRMLNQQI